MSEPAYIPYLPESAPFTAEQRAYLNGFFAGLFSRSAPRGEPESALPAKTLLPVSILFGSQTGNAETLAKRIGKEAARRGLAPAIHEMSKYPVGQLATEKRLLIVTSTYGDGEPPDNARSFWDFLRSEAAPKLSQTVFTLCALGDSNYPQFCGFGKELDQRFESLGARRVVARVDCDVGFEEPFAKWLDNALTALRAEATPLGLSTGSRVSVDTSHSKVPESRVQGGAETVPVYSRKNPFPAPLLVNRNLNGPGSGKETRHFEIDLNGSGLGYETGDALGIIPSNCPELVDELLRVLGFDGGEEVPGVGQMVSLREALLQHYEITKIPQPFLRFMAERTNDAVLTKLIAPGVNGELTQFLWGRELIDLLLTHPEVRFAPAEFVGLLKQLNPRLYSISSSPRAHAGGVHITVSVVRYESLSRRRKGVCSTFLADRVPLEKPVPIFLHSNKNFRLPENPDWPLIMVGPGTGIAPFRGFLHQRAAIGARGKTWLFFGDQHAATDFMYRDELEALRQAGALTRLDCAFSRDQSEKIYVQDRMRENARALFDWLEQGAYFYVCGDASRMAKDVDAALHKIVEEAGARDGDQAREYVAKLKAEKRYQRDVY